MRKLILALLIFETLILTAYAQDVIYQKFRGVLRAGSILEDLKTGEKSTTKINLLVSVATKSSTDRDCFIYDRLNKPRYMTEIKNIQDLEKDLTIFPQSPDNSLNIEKHFTREYDFNIEHHPKIFIENYSGEFFNDYYDTNQPQVIKATRFQWASYYQTKPRLNPGFSIDYQQGNIQSSELAESFDWSSFYFGPALKFYYKTWGSLGLMLQKSLNFHGETTTNKVVFTSDKIALTGDIYYMDFSFGISLERQRMSVDRSEQAFALDNDSRQMSIFSFNFGYHFDQLL
jgi:hypothetical protein